MDFTSFNPATTQYDAHNAYWLGRASSLAYQDQGPIRDATVTWGFSQFSFFDRSATQAFMIANADAVIIAFRGTQPGQLEDWMTDSEVLLVKGPFGMVHAGFQRSLASVWPEITDALPAFQGPGKSVWFTGHSLGAALATLAVATLRASPGNGSVQGLYTFGSPRVGDPTFAQALDANCKDRCFRYVNNADTVTRVPLRAADYKHAGTLMYFDQSGVVHKDPTFANQFVDSAEANIGGLTKLEPEALAAHSMDRYLSNLERNTETKLS